MAIKFVYFDLGNVLYFFDHNLMCEQMAELLKTDSNSVKDFLFEDSHLIKYETGEITSSEFHIMICEKFSSQVTLEELSFAASNIFTSNRSILPVLTQLSTAGMPLGVLSNTSEAHWKFVSNLGESMLTPFQKHILSYEVNSMKPDKRIFQAAIELAGVEPEEIFYTDDIQGHIDGARGAGLDAVLYTNTHDLIHEFNKRNIPCNI